MRNPLLQLLPTLLSLTQLAMGYKALSYLADTPKPIVAVLSGSMEPAFKRGDIVLLWNRSEAINVGDIAVFDLPGREVPIVHRVAEKHWDGEDGGQLYLTKGDNNQVNDRALYPEDQDYVRREDVFGVVMLYLPGIGWPTIAMQTMLRYASEVLRL